MVKLRDSLKFMIICFKVKFMENEVELIYFLDKNIFHLNLKTKKYVM